MKKGVIIPAALFAAVFCVSFFCQRYSLIFREQIGLFLLTPDWLRETFSGPWPLSNLVGSFIGQFYGETVLGPMIPAAEITIIYLCLNSFLRGCRVPFHRLIAVALALTAWCLTSHLSTSVAITATMLISVLLWLVGCIVPWMRKAEILNPTLWEMIIALVLIAGAALFVSQRKVTKHSEDMARVVVNAGKGRWGEVLRVATPDNVREQNLLMPYAMLALNNQVNLSGAMFQYPVSGIECMELEKENNAVGHLFQSFLYESLGVPNEAIHHMFQFSANFNHGMNHLSLCRLIRLNVAGGHYRMAVKYAEILRHNLYYQYQAKRIIEKYGDMDDLVDTLDRSSSLAPVFSYDPTTDMIQIVKSGNNTPVVMDRLLAYLLLERNLEDFATLFYSFDWRGKKIPTYYQEAIMIYDNIRSGVNISPASLTPRSRGTYREYYYRKR